MTLNPLPLFALSLLASVQFSANAETAKPDLIGGTVQNRATEENLALACLQRDTNHVCTSMQFAVGFYDKNKNFQISAYVKSPISYDSVKNNLSATSIAEDKAEYGELDLDSFVGNVSLYNNISESSYTGAVLGNRIASTGDFSIAGDIWRWALTVLVTPVLLVTDGAIYGGTYTGAAILDAAQYTGGAIAIVSYNSVQALRRGHIKRKVNRAVSELLKPINQGDKIKVSAKVYEAMMQRI